MLAVSSGPSAVTSTAVQVLSEINCFTGSSEIRHLPPSVKTKLGQLVDDKSGMWQSIMASIPKTPPWTPGMPLPPANSQYLKKYTVHDIRLL